MYLKFLFLFVFFAPSFVLAKAPAWQIVPEQSGLTFTAHYGTSEIHGGFKNFGGEIVFAPGALARSHVRMEIAMASLTSEDKDASEYLPTESWLSAAKFTHAVFESKKFTHVKNKDYTAEGTLALRGKTQPVTLYFTLQEYDASHAKVSGHATLSRTAFDIGQGEWADTGTVADAVEVTFTVEATKNPPPP